MSVVRSVVLSVVPSVKPSVVLTKILLWNDEQKLFNAVCVNFFELKWYSDLSAALLQTFYTAWQINS